MSYRVRSIGALFLVAIILPAPGSLARAKETPVKSPVSYRTVEVDGLSIFYREAGRKDAPTILLLHGLVAGFVR